MLQLSRSIKDGKQSAGVILCLTIFAGGISLLVGMPGCGFFSGDSCEGRSGATSAACDDLDPCTSDRSVFGCCVNTPIECEDGSVCVEGVCRMTCMSDSDCDDMDLCTEDSCTDGVCESAPAVDCDDSDLCTTDSCNSDTGECDFISKTCPSAEICDSETGECVPIRCESDEECDDGVFCNGAETCENLPGLEADCLLGTDPCPDSECIEETMSCEETTSGGSAMALQDVFGDYVSGTACEGVSLQVFIGLDGSTFYLGGLDGEERAFFPDESQDGLTATATNVSVSGTTGNTRSHAQHQWIRQL